MVDSTEEEEMIGRFTFSHLDQPAQFFKQF